MATIIDSGSDSRGGRPSASSLERIALCPGSWNAERGLPNTTSKIAEQGTKLHAVMAGSEEYDLLTPDEQALIDRSRAIELKLVTDCLGIGDYTVVTEERLWFEKDGVRLYSGMFDLLYIADDGKRGLLIDMKFGFIPVTNVAENIQLRAYAVLIAKKYGLTSIHVGVIQPRCTNQLELCHYAEHDLKRAENHILGFIQAAEREDAPRYASEKACKYCKAKGVCPEAAKSVQALVPIRSIDTQKKVTMLANEELSRLLDVAELAEEVIAAVREEAKARIAADPSSLPMWYMKPNSGTREVTNTVQAFNAIEPYGVTSAEYMDLCKPPIGKLEILFAKKSGLKGQAAKDRFNSILADVIEKKPKAASLARVTP